MTDAVLADVHAGIEAAIAELDPQLREISLDLHEHPELAMAEHRSAALLRERLAAEGFRVETPVAGLDTAFVAEVGSGAPVIAYLLEYDALPGIGHGCGHNLIATGGLGAALALHRALPEPPGTVRVVGTPGEEGRGGKIIELEAGVFDDVDAALMFHPGSKTTMIRHALASLPMTFRFHGRAAHAAGSPTKGRSALAAVIQLFVAVDALRQFLPDLSRVHGVILRAYIESNLAFMRDHRNNVIAMIEISRSAEGRHIFYGDTAVINAVGALEHALSGFQTTGEFRPDFDPHVMAIAIRAAIEAASPRLALHPEFDIDKYSGEIITIFDLATRVEREP